MHAVRLDDCYETSIIPKNECAKQIEDYLECNNSYKIYEKQALIQQRIKLKRVKALPVYDIENDRFLDINGNEIEKPKLPLSNKN